MNTQLYRQISNLSDRELLEGIYMMLLTVLNEVKDDDSKQLGINIIADMLVDKFTQYELK